MRRAVVLIESPEHVSYRYRWEAFRPYLAATGWRLSSEVLARSWWRRLRQFEGLRSAQVVVLARRLLPRWQLAVLRRCAKRLVFDFDDAVFLRDSYSHKPHASRLRSRRFAAAVTAADLVIAGNTFLARHAAGASSASDRPSSWRKVCVVPTVVDSALYDTGSRSRGDKAARAVSPCHLVTPSPRHLVTCSPPEGVPVQLVWIGCASTAQAFGRARELFERLGQEVPGLALRVISDRMPRFQHLPVVACTWSRETECRDLLAGDIGVSWLPDDPWSRGKCGLKVLQYMAAGLPVVVNPVGVQAEFVRHSGAGFVAESADDWCRTVKRLAGDAALRREMGAAGRRFVCEFYSTTAWAADLVGMLSGLVGVRSSDQAAPLAPVAAAQRPPSAEPVELSL